MSDPVVLSYGDALLRASDLQILQSDAGWLNDRIIGYVFESVPIPFVHTMCHCSMLWCNGIRNIVVISLANIDPSLCLSRCMTVCFLSVCVSVCLALHALRSVGIWKGRRLQT